MTPDDAAAHLRSERNLRALTPEEEGNPVSVLPAGIYGFTYSPSFELTPLFASKRFRNFEYHKLADGSVELVGYVTAVEAEHVRSGVGGFEVQLYPGSDRRLESARQPADGPSGAHIAAPGA